MSKKKEELVKFNEGGQWSIEPLEKGLGALAAGAAASGAGAYIGRKLADADKDEKAEKGDLGAAITGLIQGSGSTPAAGAASGAQGAGLVQQSEREVCKDDAPHEAGSPEDSAHDVAEEGSSLEDEIKGLDDEEKKIMLQHLRTLKDKRKHRSEKNKDKGKD